MSPYSGTYGALLLGALFASGFSGIVAIQSLLYFKLYPKDKKSLQALVLVVWLFDVTHTTLVWAAMWDYMVENLGEDSYEDHIPGTIAFSVVLTAALTFLTHCFFAHRIYRLSRGNWYLTVPVLILALGRLASASVSGGEMIKLKSYEMFRAQFRWLFSMGLALSSGADVLITVLLFVLLRQTKAGSLTLGHIIDACILYTFETGSLTSVATVVSMICWITLDNSLIFLGLHFIIGKLYANSLLASLNTRKHLRRSRATVTAVDLMNMPHLSTLPRDFQNSKERADIRGVQVNVIKSVQYDVDVEK
ncbi:hypothetical protein BDN70DRAFT_719999 [Pholiota conissans]|uniref:DUF6534 domain-containing protein n=1 Tax=Pholiota conissans TaxID=109636 RepID=A0A9P5Z2F3_9AGAR|nr:hypothetical protein BDN70DRAFT_719999 [Pholiota conissans]